MRYRTWVWLWLRELWIDVTTRPMLLVPHPHQPRARPGEGYQCGLCGSRSGTVQRKGNRMAERLREKLRRELA